MDVSQAVRNSALPRSWIRSHILRVHLEDEVYNHHYHGSGTDKDPYIVDYLDGDPQNAQNIPRGRKWAIAIFQSIATFSVTFASSVYASGINGDKGVIHRFGVSVEVATLGLSLFVLGFALGPLVWAPLSEVYGRRAVFVVSFAGYTAFSVATACSQNIASLLALRFFASAFGSSAMTNAGGIISDMFRREERGLASSLFSATPFLGPAFGPIVGGFLGETKGWRWILALVAILAGVIWIITALLTKETYAPFILRCRVYALSRATGKAYVSRLDLGQPPKTLSRELSVSLTRPWALLFLEPIVLFTSIYVAIIYGTLYMFFPGFTYVFEGARGWSQGIAGLPFIGIATGVCLATLAAALENRRYVRVCAAAEAEHRPVEPEARLRPAMYGSIVLPIGLFLFAWTTYPSVHWIVPTIGATLFACGLVMVFTGLVSYMIDSYVIYAASAMATNSLLRSLFATGLPLLANVTYKHLGNQWASSIPAFLTIACLPCPFLFKKYGPQIRAKCKYAAEAARISELMHRRQVAVKAAAAEPEKKS